MCTSRVNEALSMYMYLRVQNFTIHILSNTLPKKPSTVLETQYKTDLACSRPPPSLVPQLCDILYKTNKSWEELGYIATVSYK